jgi:hypothetical protein
MRCMVCVSYYASFTLALISYFGRSFTHIKLFSNLLIFQTRPLVAVIDLKVKALMKYV